ncbi:2-dehydropantoate 2-reductase [Colletotrichum higginsianum]|uniref:2-dehydropantoate 2-reductase n=1 Tax=Colletotrichum higginsianum (strain IMI 349063) TaxID=759273 RepID=H1VC87_COLHI|nr:2-dehydropantoate 2-reductase [Colletotrichum higginsianum IMI 349063]OBR10691.1 2-dehydropantoate 2-reductase [Colletotrichum higginsianum IMI 349063]GJD00916.1 2-dehydropantoate 2-reductase [Colletotrichum higginsianum]CCF37840.1 2-dehydropantoate 2-reductase [Colletotrichum higginsianum]
MGTPIPCPLYPADGHYDNNRADIDIIPRAVNIIFIGAGAVGCFYASRLHHPGRNIHVSLVARSNYKAINDSGVKLQTHSFGDYLFKPYAAFPSVEAAASPGNDDVTTHWDYVFVTTKALPDRSDDSLMIAPLVGPSTIVVLIQNGVGVEEPFRRRFPNNPIVSAVTVVSAEQTSPGVIRQNRWTRVSIGPHTNGLGTGDSELGRLGTRAVEQLGMWWGPGWGGIRDIEPHDEVGLQTVRWHKLCINAAFNPSAVLSGGRGNADMVTDPELREHVVGIMNEIRAAVPRILGREFPDDLATPDRIVKSTERNAGAKPSMLLDWEAGRPLELEVILGNPVRIARAHGVEMPRLQTLYALLKSAQAMREEKANKGKL